MPIDTGGTAFPTSGILGSPGMSLRDWFAGQAIPYVMGLNKFDTLLLPAEEQKLTYGQILAIRAYGFADDMLAERAKEAK